MLIEVAVTVLLLYVVKRLATRKDEKVLGIYSVPGMFYWLKWVIFSTILWMRSRKMKRWQIEYDDGSDLRYLEDEGKIRPAEGKDVDFGAGRRLKLSDVMSERIQPVEDSPFGIDAVYFNGIEDKASSIKDNVSLVMAFTMRYRNYAEILFMINMPGVGFLEHPSAPDRIICDAWTDDYTYNGQGMTIEMLEPMRRWRLKYNGLMRVTKLAEGDRKVPKSSGEMVHVKFSIIWRSYSSAIDFDLDLHPGCFAHSFACERWDSEFFDNVKKYHAHQSHYEQWGHMQGTIQVADREPQTVLLRGLRDRSFSKRDWNHFHRYIIMMIHLEDGTSINVSSICMDVTLSRITLGYVIQPNRRVIAASSVDLNLWEFGEDGQIPEEIKFSFTAGGRKYCGVSHIRIIPEHQCGFDWEGRLHENFSDFYVNGIPGHGITEMYYRNTRRFKIDRPVSVKRFAEALPAQIEDALRADLPTVQFKDEVCKIDTLVGGKGSQLAVLSEWAYETDKFKVPRGFCITTTAFRRHLQSNPFIEEMIEELSTVPCSSTDNLHKVCEKICKAFEDSSIHQDIQQSIESCYADLCSNGEDSVAVRSSAVGEDSSDLSAAGQLDTYLGVKGSKELIEAVKKCWGCQYSYTAVQYRKQHGQPTFSSMGVVVQAMVDRPTTSGVMFTQHPITGNPAQTMITANYGIGETVVSGRAEPDTIVVACSPNNNPEILQKSVGTKAEKMVLDGEGKVQELHVSEGESNVLSLTEKQIFDLAEVGKTIQAYFGSAKDIEWAIAQDGKINLLQARPITADPTETEFEILHEFDSALPSENYILTTANIGEMMTGAMTPLTSSTFLRSVGYGMQDFMSRGCGRAGFKYNEVYVSQSHNHPFLGYTEMLTITKETNITSRKESMDVNIFGEVYDGYTAEDAIRHHDNAVSLPRRIWYTAAFWKNMFVSRRKFVKLLEVAEKLELQAEDSKNLYRVISENLTPYYAEMWRLYLVYASLSGMSNTLLMTILSKGQAEWKTSHYSDVAMVYGTCHNVVSVDAPSLLNKTAKLIHESADKDKFIELSPQEAMNWLVAHEGECGEAFRMFLEKCGHRCIKEAEMREKSWASDPTKLAGSLQALVKNYVPSAPKKVVSVDEVIEKIKTPITNFGKLILRWGIPKARSAVGGREWGKSKTVEICDKFKRAYWKLAHMMQKEGYIPDEDLLFFFSHGEIGKVLRTRSARLITRAIKRRRMHSQASELIFPEISVKVPLTPINSTDQSSDSEGLLQVQGCPVSHGVVKGEARVVLNLAHAGEIKQGDILIVRTTDVGWSPYFPLISGLVTEIGGLISHGAVVAREYGLPCIVSAKKATQLFKSGDSVLVDGGKGIVKKLMN